MPFEYQIGEDVEVIIRGRIRARTESDARQNEYLVEGSTPWGAFFKKFVPGSVVRSLTPSASANDNDNARAA